MAIKTEQNKNVKQEGKRIEDIKLKAIIELLNIQRDMNMTRVYSAILPSK